MTRLALLVALLTLTTFAAAENLGPDLLGDGGFEKPALDPAVWHWSTAGPERTGWTLDQGLSHAGEQSLRMHSELPYAPHTYCGFSRTVSGLVPESTYVIRLWAKGEGVGNCWFGGGPGWYARQAFPSGNFDWTLLELRWTAPEVPTDFELRLNVDSETTWLWVDDITFQELDPLGETPRIRPLPASLAVRQGYLLMASLKHGLRLDGDLSDWPAETVVTRLPADAGLVVLDRQGDEDLSATLRAAADDRALYLGVTVRDDVHWAAPGALAWTNDSLQVAFDPLLQRTVGGYGPHDSEYSLMLDAEGKPQVQCWQTPQGLGDRSRDLTLAARRVGDETTYEVALPWSALGVPVGSGLPALGLNVLVNDNDGSGRRGYIELTGGIGKVKDPSIYVTALSAGQSGIAVLPARPLVYTDDPLDLKAVVVLGSPLTAPATIELTALDAKGRATPLTSATLPEGTGGIQQLACRFAPGRVPASTTRLSARLTAAGKLLAAASSSLQISAIKGRLIADAEALRTRTAGVVALAEKAEARGIATDYERVALTVCAQFVDFALDDLGHDRPARAEHVLDVLTQTLTETERTLRSYLRGASSPLLVPRYQTGKIELKRGAFYGDTLIPSTGKRERRPVFFTGFGHFGSVVRDMDKLAAMGTNILQIECGPSSTQPAEGVVTDQPVRDYIGNALQLGERNSMTVCFLTSPHYFPGWALAKWPELLRGGGGFFGLAVDAPQAREIFRTHLQTAMRAVGDSPALHSVCLSNEPTFTNWQADPFRRAAFTRYLTDLFGTIEALNATWGTAYPSFAQVPILATDSLPSEAGMTPLRYEMARFNMRQFSEYHRFMADVVRETRPGTWAHAKVMCVPANRQHLAWGTDPEQFANMGDLNGNDCSCMFAGYGNQYAAYFLGQNAYYDLQRSMRPIPVINTEDHIIVDREQRLIPARHTDFALWQGAIHGRGASCIWVWERTYDRTHDFEGSIMHRPENAMAVGRVALDLQRLATQVVALQRAQAPVGLIYSVTAQLWSDDAFGAMLKAYEALNTCGVPVRFVSEAQAAAGELRAFRAVIAPSLKHAPESLARAIADYCASGREVWVVGDAPVCGRDEYNRPRDFSLPIAAVQTFPSALSARELWPQFMARLRALDIVPMVTVVGADGSPAWGVEYRCTRDAEGWLLSITNLWGLPQSVRVSLNGRPATALQDLRTARTATGSQLSLQPLEATILRVR